MNSAGRIPSTITRSAGRMRWTRRSSGPSRSPRISAARATAWSSPGRHASKTRAASALSSTMSLTFIRRILEAAGVQSPSVLNGVPQKPVEGVSMVYTFDDAKAPSHRHTQYFEMLGNRAIYNDGWVAATTPPTPPWSSSGGNVKVLDYKWELYRVTDDFSEANNLVAKGARQAARIAGFVLGGSGQIQRAAAGQQQGRAPRHHQSPQPHAGPHGVHLLSRPGAHSRGRGPGHEEQVVQNRRHGGDSRRWCRRHADHPGRALRRLGLVSARGQTRVLLQPRRS